MIGSVVYGAFGGHCDLFNYTGLMIGVDVNLKQVITNFATEAGPFSPGSTAWDVNGRGGQGGIWMSSMAPATDGDRLFFVTVRLDSTLLRFFCSRFPPYRAMVMVTRMLGLRPLDEVGARHWAKQW